MEARQCRMCRPAHGETGRRERRTRVTTSPSIRSTVTPTIKSKGCASAASWSCGAHAAKRRPRARPVDHRGLKSGIIATLDASPGLAHASAGTPPAARCHGGTDSRRSAEDSVEGHIWKAFPSGQATSIPSAIPKIMPAVDGTRFVSKIANTGRLKMICERDTVADTVKLFRTCSSVPSQPQCGAKIVVLERTCHACDFRTPATDLLGNRLPCPGHVGHLPDRRPSLFQRQAKKLCRIFQ
ncbi:hypothetical protein DM82_1699 [Burkholderia oklahomensis]|uniref:Uncharacterized protein n=1 Tax=Burkholderia oklahomensis TaxID=342113 RepID=A0AAI8FLV7_9BURK|nr:hypothetical protein DM82_1699 [Burkholderia oklahomensis]